MSNPEDADQTGKAVTGQTAAATGEAPYSSAELAGTTSSIARLSNGERVESAEIAQMGADYWTRSG
jgi:hypothetical protein